MPDFLGAFYFYKQETLKTRDGEDVSIEVCEVGKLNVTSGNVVACDGLIPSTKAFAETVKPGAYRVLLSLAGACSQWPTVACAMLRLKEEIPAVWKPAFLADQDEPLGPRGKRFSYGVDIGVGCFADLIAMQLLLSDPDLYTQMRRKVNSSNAVWTDFCINDTGTNVIVFSSGYGDGQYPTYCGYDNDANLLCFATDFGVIDPLVREGAELPSKYQLSLDL